MKHASVQQQKRRRRSGRWRSAGRRLAAALLLALCLAAPAQASETQTVHDSSGRAMFQISFFDEGEHVLTYADGGTLVGERDLTDLDREGTVRAAGLWADILGPYGANSSPVVVHVTGDYTYNAAAVGDVLPPSAGSAYSASRALAQIGEGLETDEIAGLVFSGLGVSDSASWVAANHLSALPYTDRPDLVTVIFHEFGHLLGISSSISSMETNVFLNELGSASVWDSHLHDICGTQVQAGMRAVRAGTEAEGDAGAVFVAGVGPTSGVTFRGEHVAEVLQGAMEGVPVNGFEGSDASGWKAELAHIELNHSLMSHQLWRNWTSFMEAELAVLQDLGYQIDRRNWYGYSVYNDGLTLTSTNGYWARNAEGTAYLEGVANTSTLGVGLHVYGSNNQITQAADLMACGTAGTGIRLEGAGNTLAVAEGVTVAADGDWGTGLLVSYGRDHLVTNSGTVTATGEGGIAVRFDFGKNSISEESESRGSWIWGSDAESGWTDMDMSRGTDNDGLPLNLDGPMVSRFALSGTLAGSAAAIYISDNAYVEQMDILSGASITGDIVSNWDPESARLQYADLNPGHSGTELTTLVTFGLAATDQGIGGETGDAAFCLVYDGNITGASSLEIEVAGGALEYNGTASVLSVTIDEGASLSGTGSWTLNAILDEEQDISVGGTFTNAGTYSPGTGLAAGDGSDAAASVSIAGDYTQTEAGRLVLDISPAGAEDVLTVSGTASLAGTLTLAAARDYYGADFGLALADMVQAASLAVSDSLAVELLAASPTLTMVLTNAGAAQGAEYIITASRAADAYSRYSLSGQQADLARNFDEIGQMDLSAATGDLGDARNLLTALDFSASDGTALPHAYRELGPDAYTRAGQASLALQRSLTAQIVNGRLLAPAAGQTAAMAASASSGRRREAQAMAAGDESPGRAEDGSMRVFATPMGGRNVSFSDGGADSSYYGLLAGAETDLSLGRDSLTLGVHAAFLHTEGSANDNDTTRGDNIALGLHGRYDPALSLDAGSLGTVSPYVMGLVRGGLETRHMEREVSFNGYRRKAESDWTAPTLSAMLGTGLDVRPCETFVFGPVLWLEYTAMWRPEVGEEGGLASDLDLDAATYQSLRSSLGARMAVRLHDGPDAARLAGSLDLSLTAVWNHEYLYDNGATTARFAHFGSTSFTDRADVADRDTFGGMLQLTGHLSENVSLSLFGGLEQGSKTSDARGGASLVWSF